MDRQIGHQRDVLRKRRLVADQEIGEHLADNQALGGVWHAKPAEATLEQIEQLHGLHHTVSDAAGYVNRVNRVG